MPSPSGSVRGGVAGCHLGLHTDHLFQAVLPFSSYNPFDGPNENPEAELPLTAGKYLYVYGDMDEDGFYEGQLGCGPGACWGRATHLASLRGALTARPAPTALYGRVSSPLGCCPHHVPEVISCLSHLTAPAPWAPPADPFPSRMGGGLDGLRATPPTSGSCCCLAHVLLHPSPSFQ